MPGIIETLAAAGIPAYGTPELKRYEDHVARFLEREYRRLEKDPSTPAPGDVVTDQGPMWAETEALMDEHFDDSLELFQGFLDPEFMAYTMAYYGEDAEAVTASQRSLEEAERAKFRMVCERAGLRGDERVFNIGCGFGPLETYLFDVHPEVRVTSITPSQTQIGYIESRRRDPARGSRPRGPSGRGRRRC